MDRCVGVIAGVKGQYIVRNCQSVHALIPRGLWNGLILLFSFGLLRCFSEDLVLATFIIEQQNDDPSITSV